MVASSVTFSMEVSQEEKDAATRVRDGFSEFLEHTQEFQDFFQVFFDSIDQVNESKQLLPIAAIIKRYQLKLRELYNNAVRSLGSALHEYGESFSDTKMDSMRDIVIQNMAESRSRFIDLMHAMDSIEDDKFLEDAKELYADINKYLEKVRDTVADEWFGHIDHDILGKIRLSSLNLPLYLPRGEK